ncbi:MAG: hypothetical protein PUC33_00520 [Oscillospiraceae bacterium]|nr:hypothetical protein [Oscillospiraceae bacterium]MDD6147185.1 hypothetical protein [Oscillospiraceae bacterium]
MKKLISILLAAVLLFTFAACGGKAPEAKTYEGTLTELTDKLYETNKVEFMVMPATPVDFADEYAVNAYLGLDSTEGLKEAIFSESMIGSQAYSLVLVRVEDPSAIEEVKSAMFKGINPAKWICVEADQLRVVSSGDIIMLVMVASGLAPELADGMVEAFKTNVGELSGETLTKG